MAEQVYKDYHQARQIGKVLPDPKMKDPDDIVEYAWKQKVTKVGDGPDDYVVSEEMVEVSRCKRQAFIMKDADQVGVLNILEKVRRSGDITLLNQTGAVVPNGLQDYTDVPENIGDALKALETGSNSFEGLKAIFGDVSFNDLAGMSSEQVAQYLAAYINKEGENK